MLLLLTQDLANVLRHCVFLQGFALHDTVAVGANRRVLVVEVGAEHPSRIIRLFHRQSRCRRHSAQVVDLLRDRESVLQLLASVNFKLSSDRHVLRALQHLGVHRIRDDGLVFAGEVLVELFDQLLARNLCRISGSGSHNHSSPNLMESFVTQWFAYARGVLTRCAAESAPGPCGCPAPSCELRKGCCYAGSEEQDPPYLLRNVLRSLNSMMMNSAASSRFSAACTLPSPHPSAPASTVSFSELPSGTVKFIV